MPFGIRKPFKKDSVDDYQGVLVPLSQAQRHHTVAAELARRKSLEADTASGQDPARKSKDKSPTRDLENGPPRTSSSSEGWTIEDVKWEIDADVAASGHDTVYDSMYIV